MAPRDRNSCLRADRGAAFENGSDRLDGQFVERHPEDGQSHHRFATHRINVGYCVRRGNAPEVAWVVDHRHEKIGRRDNAVLVIDLPYRRIVTRFRTDEELRKWTCSWLLGEKLLQH